MNESIFVKWMDGCMSLSRKLTYFFSIFSMPDVIYAFRCNLLKKVKGNTSSLSKKLLPYFHICKLPCAIVLIRILNSKLKGTGNGRNFVSVCQLKYVSIARKKYTKEEFSLLPLIVSSIFLLK